LGTQMPSMKLLFLCALLPANDASSLKAVANKHEPSLENATDTQVALKKTFEEGDQNNDGYHSIIEIQDVLLNQAKSSLIQGFNHADKNHDGVVTQEEYIKFFPNKTVAEFQETDENNDGKHTLDEQLNHFAGTDFFLKEMEHALKTATEILKHDDKDGDGRLSEEEFMAHSKTLLKDVENEASFKNADTNGDGQHSADEIVTEIMRVAGFVKHAGGHFIEHGVEEAFKAADLNGDGDVTKEEYLKAWENATAADFERSDVNKDGKTNLAEASKFQSEHLLDTLKLAKEEAKKHIAAADKNGDGQLNLTEKNHAVHLTNSDLLFKASDTNSDGFHDQAEIQSEMIRQAGYTAVIDGRRKDAEEFKYYLPDSFISGFRHADANNDEIVTQEEFLKAYEEHNLTAKDFKDHDHDGDGVHSLTELAQKILETDEYKKLHKDAEEKSKQLIRDADKDGDGKISAKEFADHLLANATNDTKDL